MTFIESIKNTCLTHKLLSRGDRIVVGVSGGPDSIALLYALEALHHDFGLQLFVAHLNHGLRPESIPEQAYVKELAKKLGLPLFTKTVHLQKIKGSLEEKAREARIAFLVDTTKKVNAHAIALGHHQDDLAETILMRMIRGTGPMGIKCILPKRTIQGITFIRPLLETNRCAIEKFLKTRKIRFYVDASNLDTQFLRNKIRHHLIPLLEKNYNPSIKKTLIHFSQSTALLHNYVKKQAEGVLSKFSSTNKKCSSLCMDLKAIRTLHPAVLRETMRLGIEKLLGHTRALTFAHIQALEDLVQARPNHAIVDLPYKLSAIKKNGRIIITTVSKTTLDKKKKDVIIT